MGNDSCVDGPAIIQQYGLGISKQAAALMAILEAKPGAVPKAMFPPRAARPNVLIYKVMGKMFAIMGIRDNEGVILKCDPSLVPMLREQYQGVGHRSHLDPRNWISVEFDADVPAGEIKQLATQSYELVCSGLTRKQKAELALLQD